ncbi:MAG: HAMP domain-containing sensor histidine kinase [Chitinophagaceae bacterium]
MEITARPFHHSEVKNSSFKFKRRYTYLKERIFSLVNQIKLFGFNPAMEEYEQRKLSIFNQLNFLQLVAGILIPLSGLLNTDSIPLISWIVMGLPALVSLFVLYLNYREKHEFAYITYFIFYPFVTCFIYLYGMNPGTTLFFILYGVLSVFFLKDTGYMVFSLCFSMISYFLLAVVIRSYPYELHNVNYSLYSFNQIIAILFIFYGLFLIKKENTGYQVHILSKNTALQEKNIQIQQQSTKIKKTTTRLKQQAEELKELNAIKNKMFSIISHDLKAPIHGLRSLFRNVEEKRMTITELKKSIPEIQNDLNYIVGLMDNLLHWAKVQMQKRSVYPQKVDINRSIYEVLQLLHLQAKAKQITIVDDTPPDVFSNVDKDMISLVLRNLISNAIKFTPEKGTITIGVYEHHSFIEVYVKDTGDGITTEALEKINNRNFYTTKGTASESGTGLGLMLCKEFLECNGSQLHIETEQGTGSTFSFSLRKTA